jgi:uncharacterized protein YbjQ (UPF0145 family)
MGAVMAAKISSMCNENPVEVKGLTRCFECDDQYQQMTDEEKADASNRSDLLFEQSLEVECFTTELPGTLKVSESLGLVFGSSSKQAFWGFSTQSNRLTRAYEVALADMKYEAAAIGANAIVAIRFALNNSTGSAAALAGSSEAVVLIGTAVITH